MLRRQSGKYPGCDTENSCYAAPEILRLLKSKTSYFRLKNPFSFYTIYKESFLVIEFEITSLIDQPINHTSYFHGRYEANFTENVLKSE